MLRFLQVCVLAIFLYQAGDKAAVPSVVPRAANGPQSKSAPAPIKLVLSSDRASGSMDDAIHFTAWIENTSDGPVFVHSLLEWGPSSSLFLTVADEKGQDVSRTYYENDFPLQHMSRRKVPFIKLYPQHILGVTRTEGLSELVPGPGLYDVQVKYHCPVSKKLAGGLPAWGSEDPILLSNIVRIRVQ